MDAREKAIDRVTLAGSAVNVVLTVFKFVAGLLGRSAAMTADAVHSLSDLLTDAVVLIFVHISNKPADRDHEYGHGKFETLASSLVGVALLVVAGGIIYHAGASLAAWCRGADLPAPGMLALWAALASILLKETIYQYTWRQARKLGSPALEANAWHHRSDALSSVGALAGIGATFLFLTGYQEWSTTQSSVPAMGFNGIAATFLGGLHPIGTIFASFFIQSITDGGALIDKSLYPSQISDLISAIIIYLCGFVLFFKFALNNWIGKRDKGGPNVNDVPVTDDAAKAEGGDK